MYKNQERRKRMKSIFQEGKKEDIPAVLAAKDKRVAMQQAIFGKYPKATLVDVNLNIPGPIKNNHYLTKLFQRGINELENNFKQKNYDFRLVAQWNEDTGAENFYVINKSPEEVKLTCIDFEDHSSIGRLFDADVLIKDNKMALSRKNLGQPVRQCFLCQRPAKECSRSRRHSVKELQDYISQIYWKFVA